MQILEFNLPLALKTVLRMQCIAAEQLERTSFPFSPIRVLTVVLHTQRSV
jgi:hypothetical protein